MTEQEFILSDALRAIGVAGLCCLVGLNAGGLGIVLALGLPGGAMFLWGVVGALVSMLAAYLVGIMMLAAPEGRAFRNPLTPLLVQLIPAALSAGFFLGGAAALVS